MIAGILTSGQTAGTADAVERFLKAGDETDLVYNPVSSGHFAGGFLLHLRLPWRESDFVFTDPVTGLLVLVSGAVYNADELQVCMPDSGPVAVPALITSLFLKEGPGFVLRLSGDFVIFIHDTQKSESYLYRDHVGVRPVAWSVREGSLYFSSDILRLSAALGGGRPPEDEYLAGYFRYADRLITPNDAVRWLLPGHYLHFSNSVAELTCYWHPESFSINRGLTYERALSDLGEILRDAVRTRCDKRFFAGAHVSSGIDSGIVAVLARREYSEQEFFPGYSWSPEVTSGAVCGRDERDAVRAVCGMAGITPVFSGFSPGDLIESVSSLYGNPVLFYEWETRTQASGEEVNLLFSGWGGDEFISISDRGIDQDLLRGMHLGAWYRKSPFRHPGWFLMNQLRFVLFPALGLLDRPTRQSFRDDARYLKRGYRKSDRRAVATYYFHASRRQVHLNMLWFLHLQKRSGEWMTAGYRQGVEYRYPLLDRRLIEYMLTVPSVILCRANGPRALVRDLSDGLLPESVRESYSKSDPVSLAHTNRVYEEAAIGLMDEVAEWRSSGLLKFLDFALLERDINDYNTGSRRVTDRVLFRGLVKIKAAYEFARRYMDCG